MMKKIINIPNAITSIGILAIFVYIAGYVFSFSSTVIMPALIIVGASDMLDGLSARILNQQTFVGLILDKIRDTLLFLAIIGNLLWIGTPGAILFLKAMIAVELIMLVIIVAAPSRDSGSDHLFHKIRQGAYLIIVLYFAILR